MILDKKLQKSCFAFNLNSVCCRVHCSVYLQLWAAVQTHIVSEKKSHLSKCKKSEELWNWNTDVSTINVKSTDLSEEKENSLTTSSDFVENLEDLED